MDDDQPSLTDGTVTLHPGGGGDAYVIEIDDTPIGTVAVREVDIATGDLSWSLVPEHRGRGYATRAVRVMADLALAPVDAGGLGLHRVEAHVPVTDEPALRVATRSGLRREGVRRTVPGAVGAADAHVVLARLSTDPPLTEPGSFRALLNSSLPRKRAIAQLLVRDPDDRVLLCRLTYKQDWDLPGGVVEVGESPRTAVAREVVEELSLELPAGRLLLTDWLPPWGGWDDALCLVHDGGVHDPALLDRAVLQPREIQSVQFCTPDEVREHCADFTARRIEAALAVVHRGQPGGDYTESGRL